MRIVKYAFFLFWGLLLTACATITRGTKDTLVIETEPPNASVTLSNGLTCTTPCSVKLPRKEAVVVKIKKEGYYPVEVNVTPQISGAGGLGMAGNVVLGGLIGAAIDAGSGSMYNLKPNPIKVKLEKIENIAESNSLEEKQILRKKTIAEKLEELNKLKEKGLITEEEYLKLKEKFLNEEL